VRALKGVYHEADLAVGSFQFIRLYKIVCSKAEATGGIACIGAVVRNGYTQLLMPQVDSLL